MDRRGESWIVKESRGKAYGKHGRVKGLPRRGNFQDQQESNRALFIAFHRGDYLSSPVRRQLYPAGEELRGLSLRLVNRRTMTQTGRHWQFRSLRYWLSFCATSSWFIERTLFSRVALRGIKFHSSRKYVAISGKRRDDTITYTRRVMMYYWQIFLRKKKLKRRSLREEVWSEGISRDVSRAENNMP